MKKIIFFFTLLITFLHAYNQEIGFKEIDSWVEDNPGKLVPIRIEFKDNIDCFKLNQQFKDQQTPVNQRPKIINRLLKEQAVKSQEFVIDFLKKQTSSKTNYHSFWIVNIIIAYVDAATIEKLLQFSNIFSVKIENNQFIAHDDFEESADNNRTPNGVENGLIAINAPAMWALGYTGRGRLAYNYDTGVWPNHPAFSNRFIGDRFPMQQSWIGYFNTFPNGSIQNHGTHTLGTIAGLVESTNDTIGVAFGSYWIANDFVTSTVQALPPIVNMIEAFQWALNPDNDTSTTEDVPDVINNSWRWYDGNDTIHCQGFVVNLMNAIEAAGIANVFSGGNSGPSNSSVNSPQRINTSEVNTFCVGSVNGNISFPYPISNFSTRGPSQCSASGSLAIHPEVVAPGQNVRSAWEQNNFNTISGTSMAAPHVSGAILLLKEAFPFLSGEELLWALYLSAVDLGVAGEDNVYGMGMIDVYAAFLHLSQIHTPVDPSSMIYDLHLDSLTIPNFRENTCENTFTPTVFFKNLGDFTITNIEFTLKINGDTILNNTWTGSLAPNSTSSFTLPVLSGLSSGKNEIQVLANLGNSFNEYDYFNNSTILRFSIIKEITTLPFIEDFENGINDTTWIIENIDLDKTWGVDSTSGLPWSDQSACIKLFSYAPRNNQKDGLVTPKISLSSSNDLFLTFDIAYQKRSASGFLNDTLKVFVSNNCGLSYDYLVYQKHGYDLSTFDTSSFDFVPEYFTHWRNDTIDLSSLSNEEILVKFETTNRAGNNLYLDNIKVFEGLNAPASISKTDLLEFELYPNPTGSNINILFKSYNSNHSFVTIYNPLGEVMLSSKLDGYHTLLPTKKLSSGIYIVQLFQSGKSSIKSFIKWED
ncbi:MAG: Bacillopeptidase F [Crocinitomicaceae bacterium]|nr:MAG: Bacillopeptidase F [Crocinitomicaceae bacterium]